MNKGDKIGEMAKALKVFQENAVKHKRAEGALRDSEQRFKDTALSASDWFWEMGPDLRFTYHSDRYFEITGFRPEDKIGSTRTRFVDPSDPAAEAETWDAHIADLEARRPFKNFEYPFKVPNGSIFHARTSGIPAFDQEGAFLGYRGTGTDITELKKTEEALRDSLENPTTTERSEGQILFDHRPRPEGAV